jgi:hypothetical protein
MTGTWGTLTDYTKGTAIRPATAQEWLTSVVAAQTGGGTGAFFLDGTDLDVYVDGGPDSSVSDIDIDDLEQEAHVHGDAAQAALCQSAREGDEDARAECARVILGNRAETLGASGGWALGDRVTYSGELPCECGKPAGTVEAVADHANGAQVVTVEFDCGLRQGIPGDELAAGTD